VNSTQIAATVGKEIGYGSNSTIDNHWEWKYWRDWSTSGGLNESDNHSLRDYIYVLNKSASTLPFFVAANWRFIVSSATPTAISSVVPANG